MFSRTFMSVIRYTTVYFYMPKHHASCIWHSFSGTRAFNVFFLLGLNIEINVGLSLSLNRNLELFNDPDYRCGTK